MNITPMTARMIPEITTIHRQNTPPPTEGVNVDSSSDHGSEISLVDAGMIMEDGVDNYDNYNDEYMRVDDTYEDFLAGIKFNY